MTFNDYYSDRSMTADDPGLPTTGAADTAAADHAGESAAGDGRGGTSNAGDDSRRERRPDERFCTTCGAIIKGTAEIRPGVWGQSTVARHRSARARTRGLALAPDHRRQPDVQRTGPKGLALLGLQSVNVLLVFVQIGFVTAPLTWGYAIRDASVTARRIDRGELDR